MAFDFGAAGGGAAAGLEDVLKRMFLEQVQRQRVAQEQAELGERGRQADMQNSLGRSRLNLEGEELGFRRQQHADEAPLRTGRLKLMGAQTEDLNRQPIEAADARAHQGMMAERGHLDRVALENLQNQHELGQIGAQGAQQQKLAQFRLANQPQAQPDKTEVYAAERTNRILQSVGDLEQKVTPWTTGAGSLLANIPATDARNFSAELDALKANIAFGEIAEMRAASKTGGALGSVSEKELGLLSSALGALDPGQSPANFKIQLQKIRESLHRWQEAKAMTGQGTQSTVGPQDNDPLGLFK